MIYPARPKRWILTVLPGCLFLHAAWAQMPPPPLQPLATQQGAPLPQASEDDLRRAAEAAAEFGIAADTDSGSNQETTAHIAVQHTAKTTANPYLKTFLALQHQNAVLSQLLERERAVAAMVDNYHKIGVPYTAPKPDLAICAAVPENLSCAIAYPDRYADFLPPPAPLPAVPVIPVAVSTDELPQAIETLSADLGVTDLMWTDITCLQGVCRAVITPDPADRTARYSVKAGDALPPGGHVERITRQGVTVIARDGKHVTLQPAPTRPFAM